MNITRTQALDAACDLMNNGLYGDSYLCYCFAAEGQGRRANKLLSWVFDPFLKEYFALPDDKKGKLTPPRMITSLRERPDGSCTLAIAYNSPQVREIIELALKTPTFDLSVS